MSTPPQFLSRLGRAFSLNGRLRSYRLTFNGSHAGNEVLADLAEFTHAHEEVFHPDPYQHAYRAGMRAVWQRIRNNIDLTPEQYAALYPPASPRSTQ